MRFETDTSPHVTPPHDVGWVMRQVLYALVPGTLLYAWFFGWSILINIGIAVTVAVAAEALMLQLRGRPLRPFLSDYSAVVTAWLLALALPSLAPWWLTALGSAFAIVVAKQLYGGLGMNPFNPAMIGYVVLIVSFPREMTQWLPPQGMLPAELGFMDTLRLIFAGTPPAELSWDSLTAATPLDEVKTGLGLGRQVQEITTSPLFGSLAGVGWQWISLAWLAGGAWLLARGVIRWHIPVAMLASLTLLSGIFWLLDPATYASPLFHLLSGGAILGAFFIATDPISAAASPRGRLIFGAGIGAFTYIIRTWGGYPDGVAFAVLLMNMAVPLIDYYTQPRVYGHGNRS